MALEIKSKDEKKKCIYDTEPLKESEKRPLLYDVPSDSSLNESYRKKKLNETKH